MNGFRTELVEKIIGFNAHAVVKPYDQPINKENLKNKELKTLSNKLLFSNSSEGVLINKDYTKGLQLRGYTTNGFEKLDIVKNQNFYGNGKLKIGRAHV